MRLQKVSLAVSNKNVFNGKTIRPAMKHSRIYCSTFPCSTTVTGCIRTWDAKVQINMKQMQQK